VSLSRRAGSPAVIHPRATPRRPRLITARFCRLARFRASAWRPRTTMPALSSDPKASVPDELGSNDELAAYRELRLLRSVLPLTNPFATDASCPPSAAVTLLGFFPSRVFSDHASNPRPARTRRLEHAPCTRRHKARDPEELCNPERLLRPPDPGGTHLKCRSTQANSVGSFQPLCEAGLDHLSVASSPPMVFRAAGEPAAPDLRSL